MALSRSDQLENEFNQNKVTPPPPTSARYDLEKLVYTTVPVVLLAVTAIVALWVFLDYPIINMWITWIIAVPTALVVYTQYWKWQNNHVRADPTDGNMHVEDKSHPILFWIRGSRADPITIEGVPLYSPKRGFFEEYVFKSNTIIVDGKTIKGIRNLDELLAIKNYRDTIKKQELDLTSNQLAVLIEIFKAQETTNSLLDSFHKLVGPALKDLAFMASCYRAAYPQEAAQESGREADPDDTQEIPIVRPQNDDDTMPDATGESTG